MARSISVVGNINVDIIATPVTTLPPPGVERTIDSVEIRVGGAAAITALALAGLGCPPRLVGCVGDDVLGRFLHEQLEKAGIPAEVVTVPGNPTGVSIALEAPERDRSFLTSLGSLSRFEAAMVPREALRDDLVLLCGYFLLPALRGPPMFRLLKEIREAGGTSFFDCGWDPTGWPDGTRREVGQLLPLVDVFLPNGAEAGALTGRADPRRAARMLQETSGGWVVVKLGSDGCVAVGPDGREHSVPAPPVRPTDTTGAGDAFNAGLLYGLSEGVGWPESLVGATAVGSAVVSRRSRDRYTDLRRALPHTGGRP